VAWPTDIATTGEALAASEIDLASDFRAEPEAALVPPAAAEPEPAPNFEPQAVATFEAPPEAAPEEEEESEAPAPAVAEAAPAASSTLGELYLAQGHLDEAEESFHSVLKSRPGDATALAGLESVRLQRGEEAAIFAEEVSVIEVPEVIVGGLTARKAALLKDYLARLRRGAKRHVS
jgi:tetratricopeptide (TPR) repeat protein